MALRFMDGFDYYGLNNILKKWTELPNNGFSSFVTGLDGVGLAWQQTITSNYLRKIIDSQPTYIVGFWIRVSSLGSSGRLVRLFDTVGNGQQVELRLNSDGTLSITRNGSALTNGTSVSTILANTWYYFEWKMTISTSITASSCVLRVNNVDWITVATGQNTRSTSNSSADAIDLMSEPSTVTFDHFFALDGTGSFNNNFIGIRKIKTLYPAADFGTPTFVGSDGNSVNNYDLIDETAALNTSDYVNSTVNGDIDLYTLTSQSFGDTLNGVQITAAFGKIAGNVVKGQIVCRPVSTNYFTSDIYINNTPAYYEYILETNPQTASSWTSSDIASLKVGVKNTT